MALDKNKINKIINSLKISVILPSYNEELTIELTIRNFKKIFSKASIVVIDNNSSDNTFNIAKRNLSTNKDFLFQEFNKGKGYCIHNAISRVDADIYIFSDSDNTYKAEDAYNLLLEMIKYRYDIVIGDRQISTKYKIKNQRKGHYIGNVFFSKLLSSICSKNFNDVFSGLRVISKPLIEICSFSSKSYQVETEITLLSALVNANHKEVKIEYYDRPSNSYSKLNTFRDGIKILNFTLYTWIKYKPLKFLTYFSVVLVIISLSFLLRAIFGHFQDGSNYTSTTVVSGTFGILSIVSLLIGIILNVITENQKNLVNISFLEKKRNWNKKMDNFIKKAI